MWNLLTFFLTRKNKNLENSHLREKIKITNYELSNWFRNKKLKSIFRSNTNINSRLITLFYISLGFNMMYLVFTVFGICASLTINFIWNFINYHRKDLETINSNIDWLIIVILYILFIILLVRIFSDAFKLCYRGEYQKKYTKFLIIDLLTLNLVSVITILIFIKKKKYTNINIKSDIRIDLYNPKLKTCFTQVCKVEILVFLVLIILFILSLIIGHYVINNSIKYICLAITINSFIILHILLIIRLIGIILIFKFMKDLNKTNNYFCFLALLKFFTFIFGNKYLAILMNVVDFGEDEKNIILKTWE